MNFGDLLNRLEAECYNSHFLVGAFGLISLLFAGLILFGKVLAFIAAFSLGIACVYFAKEQEDKIQESSSGRTVDSDSTDEGSNPSS